MIRWLLSLARRAIQAISDASDEGSSTAMDTSPYTTPPPFAPKITDQQMRDLREMDASTSGRGLSVRQARGYFGDHHE